MTLTVKLLRKTKYQEAMALLPMKQYQALLEYLEEMEDRVAVKEREGDELIPWEKVKKEIKKKVKNNKE
jgi:hypothetical protein